MTTGLATLTSTLIRWFARPARSGFVAPPPPVPTPRPSTGHGPGGVPSRAAHDVRRGARGAVPASARDLHTAYVARGVLPPGF